MAKLHFLGANRQVTGSRYCLETGNQRILVDCGMFQEREYQSRNWEPCPIAADQVDAVLLTHAHLDHCGLLPRLVRDGFAGPIYATPATIALTEIILHDSAEIQMEDAEYKRKRHRREGREKTRPPEPLYTDSDCRPRDAPFSTRFAGQRLCTWRCMPGDVLRSRAYPRLGNDPADAPSRLGGTPRPVLRRRRAVGQTVHSQPDVVSARRLRCDGVDLR